ncbi:MAG: hypothetical protein KGJ02_03340 [Verrucomicrobiota bacterium]|nr:hypothetical protein [Verrucomicrobiota bacterium]
MKRVSPSSSSVAANALQQESNSELDTLAAEIDAFKEEVMNLKLPSHKKRMILKRN